MAVTTPPGLKQARGPVLGLPHLLQLRFHPIEHNEFLRESYGEVYRLNVFGVRLYVTAGADMAEQVLVNRDRTFANGPGVVALHRAVLPPRDHAARLRRAPAPPADPAARLHQRRAAQLPLRDGAAHPAQPRRVGRRSSSRRGCTTCSRRSPSTWRWRPSWVSTSTPRGAGRGQQGVHRRGARGHLRHPQAGPGHSLGEGPEGTGVPRGLLPLAPAGQAARRAATTCSRSCAARRARTATSSATTTSSTT